MRQELGRRNYKIYINDIPLYLIHREDRHILEEDLPEDNLIISYRGQQKSLINCIDTLEKGGKDAIVIQTTGEVQALYDDFKSLFLRIKACGGLVLNDTEDRILMIKRRGFWDLPKGKMEKKEKKRQTARREVEEETGVRIAELRNKLITTRHTFRKKDGTRALKINHWYLMVAKPTSKLVPQKEEDITKVDWVALEKCFLKEPMFKSIEDVLLSFEDLS